MDLLNVAWHARMSTQDYVFFEMSLVQSILDGGFACGTGNMAEVDLERLLGTGKCKCTERQKHQWHAFAYIPSREQELVAPPMDC